MTISPVKYCHQKTEIKQTPETTISITNFTGLSIRSRLFLEKNAIINRTLTSTVILIHSSIFLERDGDSFLHFTLLLYFISPTRFTYLYYI